MTKRTLVDITEYTKFLAKNRAPTGIQRIIKSLININGWDQNFKFIIFQKNQFFQIEPVSNFTETKIINDWVSLKGLSYSGQMIKKIEYFLNRASSLFFGSNNLRAYEPQDNDVVLLFDVVKKTSQKLQKLSELRYQKNIEICCFLHDIIPLQYEIYSTPKAKEILLSFLEWLNQNVNLVIFNSNFTQDTIIKSNLIDHKIKRVTVKLAHEFISKTDENSLIFKNFKDFFSSKYGVNDFILCVGTIGKRKNQASLISVWKKLSRQRKLPVLILAGAMNNKEEIESYGLEGYPILILEKISDELLSELYKNCLFTVFPSFAEGWGLPIGESMWFNKACLASKLDVFIEFGNDFPNYFDPYSQQELEDNLLMLLDNKITLKTIDREDLVTWKQFKSNLVSIIDV